MTGSRQSRAATDELMRFLSDPRSYPHDPAEVTIVQTHISIVAIAGNLVFKVKKPVDFGFLDFTSLEKRHFYCNEEVRLNRRMCPAIYEAVVPIVLVRAPQSDGFSDEGDVRGALSRLEFGSAGYDGSANARVVEYAVRMKRLDATRFMDQLVAESRLHQTDLERVCDRLARFYEENPATSETTPWGRVDRIRISVDENFEQMRQQEGDLISHAAIRALETQADVFFARNEGLLERRRATGMIRDCHGDLHLDHVHITEDRICIYDCIEFNERFRFIDIANDIAFLSMDLDYRDRPDLSALFERLMRDRLGDNDLPVLLPFYKTYRAIVRGKVAGFRTTEHEVPDADRRAAADEARRYYRLALQYAVTGDLPMVIAVMGRVGTGKSTQAQMLGEALGWKVYSSDVIRKQTANVPLHRRGSESERTELYSSERTRQTYAALFAAAQKEVDGHRGVVLDATFSRRTDRDRFMSTFEHVPTRIIEIAAPDDVILDRLADRETSEQVVSDARAGDFQFLSSLYDAPAVSGPDAEPVIRITSAATPEATQRLLLMRLAADAGRKQRGGGNSVDPLQSGSVQGPHR